MSKLSRATDRSASDGSKSSQRADITYLLLTAADTTWRMFVPMVGFTLFGVWADRQLETKPWLMALGIAVGIVGAVLLIRNQINASKPNIHKEDSDS